MHQRYSVLPSQALRPNDRLSPTDRHLRTYGIGSMRGLAPHFLVKRQHLERLRLINAADCVLCVCPASETILNYFYYNKLNNNCNICFSCILAEPDTITQKSAASKPEPYAQYTDPPTSWPSPLQVYSQAMSSSGFKLYDEQP